MGEKRRKNVEKSIEVLKSELKAAGHTKPTVYEDRPGHLLGTCDVKACRVEVEVHVGKNAMRVLRNNGEKHPTRKSPAAAA